MTTITQHNRNLAPKKVNKFYVKFFGMTENDSNLLGRQVTSLERPTITFNVSENRNKMQKRNDVSEIEFDPITIEFNDDLNSLTNKALYNQILKQSTDNPNDYLFEIKVEVFSEGSNIAEHFVIKNCFIQSLTHSQNIYSNSENNTITATIGFGTVEYIFD